VQRHVAWSGADSACASHPPNMSSVSPCLADLLCNLIRRDGRLFAQRRQCPIACRDAIPTLFRFLHDVSSLSPPLRLQTLPSPGTCPKDWLANRDHHGSASFRLCLQTVHDVHAFWRSTGRGLTAEAWDFCGDQYTSRGICVDSAIFDATTSRVTLQFTWQAQRAG
jgi:hypothetical protein